MKILTVFVCTIITTITVIGITLSSTIQYNTVSIPVNIDPESCNTPNDCKGFMNCINGYCSGSVPTSISVDQIAYDWNDDWREASFKYKGFFYIYGSTVVHSYKGLDGVIKELSINNPYSLSPIRVFSVPPDSFITEPILLCSVEYSPVGFYLDRCMKPRP